MGRTFTQEQADVRDNYVNLHETTGESYDSIANRLEQNVGDYVTAERVRALADEDTSDVQPDPAPLRAGDVPPAPPTGTVEGDAVEAPAAPEAPPAKRAPLAEWVDYATAKIVAQTPTYPSAAALEAAQTAARAALGGMNKEQLTGAYGS